MGWVSPRPGLSPEGAWIGAADGLSAAGNGLRLDFKAIVEKANLPKTLRLYDLRHTCASLMLASGVNIKVISERLGHGSAKMTLDIYTHTQPGMQEEATARLEAVIFPRKS